MFFRLFLIKFFIFLLILIFIFPFLISYLFRPTLEFNQFLIQRSNQLYVKDLSIFMDFYASSWSDGVNRLVYRPKLLQKYPIDSQSAFDFIFYNLPLYVVVYPTEEFYYFFGEIITDQKFAGNFHLSTLSEGELFFSFYSKDDFDSKEVLSLSLGLDNGLKVRHLISNFYLVSWKDKIVLFKLPNQSWVKNPPNFVLLSEEEFVGRIFDESGVNLFLIYNRRTQAFYNILDHMFLVEKMKKYGDYYFIGMKTGFIYFYDLEYNRYILIGVNKHNVQDNNYYDGPGDQVPIHLDLKEKINRAYPDTFYENLDKNGVYLDKKNWIRVAIIPYFFYSDLQEVVDLNKKCFVNVLLNSQLWTCLTSVR
jgi:hypothetical protein